MQANRAIFDGKPPVQVLDHLAHRDGLLIHFENGPCARALQDLLESLDQVNHVGSEFRLGPLGIHELFERRVAQNCVFDLLFLQEHLRRRLEFLVLEQAVDQFAARVVGGVGGSQRVARQQHLRLDVNQHRRHVDEVGGHVHVKFADALDIEPDIAR